jgi:hypothetical protein
MSENGDEGKVLIPPRCLGNMGNGRLGLGWLEHLEETAMNDPNLESLAKRIEALEKIIATTEPERTRKDWREVVGMFRDSEFMREVDEECLRVRETERKAARRGESVE